MDVAKSTDVGFWDVAPLCRAARNAPLASAVGPGPKSLIRRQMSAAEAIASAFPGCSSTGCFLGSSVSDAGCHEMVLLTHLCHQQVLRSIASRRPLLFNAEDENIVRLGQEASLFAPRPLYFVDPRIG